MGNIAWLKRWLIPQLSGETSKPPAGQMPAPADRPQPGCTVGEASVPLVVFFEILQMVIFLIFRADLIRAEKFQPEGQKFIAALLIKPQTA